MKHISWALGLIAALALSPAAGAGPNRPPQPPTVRDPDQPWLVPPVDGPIIARFQAPGTDWGPGHRGTDFYAAPGTAVRAAASGRVAFAGSVAGVNAVTLRHAGDLQTTYTDLQEILVTEGTYVTRGEWIGRSGAAHASYGDAGVHFGVKVAGNYVDPQQYLGPVDASGAIYLTPLIGSWAREIPGYGAGSHLDETCKPPAALNKAVESPNDNIAVVVSGLASRSSGGFDERAWQIAESLGYPANRTYFFSYRGSDGPRLHEPYERYDTYGGVDDAAGKLAGMLVALGREHPGAAVDLLGYSLGGVVARYSLETMMTSWQPGVPRVDHLVTFSSPHTGSKLAEVPDELRAGTLSGALLTDAAARWSQAGHAFPDPGSKTVRDLMPGSDAITELARHDVVYGTRVLSLSAANDWIVPPVRAQYEGETNGVVATPGVSGHGAILSSVRALEVARSFLRDAAPGCATALDVLAPAASRVVDFAHDHAADIYGTLEDSVIGAVVRRPNPD